MIIALISSLSMRKGNKGITRFLTYLMQNMPLERKLFLPACLYVLMRINMLQWRSWNVLNAYVFCFSPFYVLHYFVACFSSRCFMLSSFLPYFFLFHSFYFLKFSFLFGMLLLLHLLQGQT